MQNLFSYPIFIDDLASDERKYHIEAKASDLVYLKNILAVPDVKSFKVDMSLKLSKKKHQLRVYGLVEAELELQSVVSLEYFTKIYQPKFELLFDTKANYQDIKDIDESIEADIPDIIIDGKIDLVDIAIEQVALILEDHPRKEGEEFFFQTEFDEADSQEKNPFDILAKLKK